MCTVSWTATGAGYDLFFNRDELNRRAPELPPAVYEKSGRRFLAPLDGDHGGTWLLVNDVGITVCLLNDYEHPWKPPSPTPLFSRGHAVIATAAAESLADVHQKIRSQPLDRTMPFHLLALAPDQAPVVLHWTGTALERRAADDARAPLSSSSFRTGEVIARRREVYRSLFSPGDEPGTDELARYHRQHDQTAGAHSVLMQRPDASTRSIIHVMVTADAVSMSYTPVTRTESAPVLGETKQLMMPRR